MSDKLNGQPEKTTGGLSKAEKIKAIRQSVRNSANDWDGERSAHFLDRVNKVIDSRPARDDNFVGVLDDMPEDSVPSEEIYEGLGFSDFREIIPDSDIPLFDSDGKPLNSNTEQPSAPSSMSAFPKPVKRVYADEDTHVFERKNANYEDMSEFFPELEPIPELPVKKSGKKKKKKKPLKERFLALFPQKGDSPLECVRKIVFLASIVAIVVCGYLIIDYYTDLWHSKNVNNEIMEIYYQYPDNRNKETEDKAEQKYYEMLDAAKKLLEINGDVIGVISIPETPVNNPVMKAKDNGKYLDIKINGDESRAGELFMDYRNKFDHVIDHKLAEPNSDNLVIYGHNMGNREMFGCLREYKTDDEFYSKHPLIYLNSNYECYTYKIFSVFLLDAEDKSETKYDCWNKLDFTDETDFYNFVNEAKRRTVRLNSVDVKYGDPILTLSTCNTDLGDRGRLIVMARLVREGEDPMAGTKDSKVNPNPKMPTFYNDITNTKYDENAEFIPYGPDSKEEKK